MIEVRTAVPGDGALLLQMTHCLADLHGNLDKVTATAEDYENHLFCEKPLIGCLLAFQNNEPAGAIVWHRSFSTNRGNEIIYLEDLTVLPAYRKSGVGKTLVKALAKLATERGAKAIWWMATGWNDVANGFYENLGATAMRENFIVWQLAGENLDKASST